MSFKRAVLSWLLAAAAALSLTACAGRPETDPGASVSSEISSRDSSSSSGKKEYDFINPLPVPSTASEIGALDTGYTLLAQEKHEINPDTVGWINMPGSDLSDVVVWRPTLEEGVGDARFYYIRRDFNGVPNTGPLATQFGTYFADYRCTFDGGTGGFAPNTVIYGHSMADNPNGGGFAQLNKLLDEDFAKKTPYLYFSTTEEDLAWEIFAVSYATVNLRYNIPNLTGTEFMDIINESKSRSVWNYDVEVKPGDKILTLSTCCYKFSTSYPNIYRFYVMARLVPPGTVLADEASLVKNPSPAKP